MAPATNIGSADPDLDRPRRGPHRRPRGARSLNDAAAYIRSLASIHGRNADSASRWSAQAVNITASETPAASTPIDVVAPIRRRC